jgi:leader peptidase (prepilin peptidase) / N-methyltransferase
MGSFIGVVVLREASGESVVFGRSHCDKCGHVLAWFDLIPLVSWLMLRGRCRYCHAGLGHFFPLVELAVILPVLWAACVVEGWVLLASALLGWLLLALALVDWRSLRLPDYLTATLAATGFLAAAAFDRDNFTAHLIGAAVGFAVLAIVTLLYRAVRGREGLGLGDAKLLCGLGAWISWEGLPATVLLGATTGLVFALARGVSRGAIVGTERIPFGPFLSLAGWVVWLYGPLVPT